MTLHSGKGRSMGHINRKTQGRGAVVGGLSLDFTTGSLPGGVTLTRASSATYINASGQIATAATNTARFDYLSGTSLGATSALLVEPATTNDITNSTPPTGWAGTSCVATANSATAPDGTSTACLVTASAATASTFLSGPSVSYTNGVTRTDYYCVKQGTQRYIQIPVLNSAVTTNAYANFDLQTGAVTQSSGLVGSGVLSLGSGWRILWVTFTPNATATGTGIYLWFINNPTDGFAAPGTFAGTETVFVWGAQNTAEVKVSSLIPTAGSGASRSADVVSFTIPVGITSLTYTFDDNTTQTVGVASGAYTIPTNLNRSRIKTIVGS